MLDFRLDLPVSASAVLFGVGMLAWFAVCVGLRSDHVVVWGALIVIGLVPVWGALDAHWERLERSKQLSSGLTGATRRRR
jgi:hypothetical protein